MNADTFLARLKHAVLSHPVLSHPIWSEIELGYYDREALRVFSARYYHHVLRTRLYDAAALACCPLEEVQAALASIVWDEYGHGRLDRTHPAQFRTTLRAQGLDPARVEAMDRLPELEAYSALHFGLCCRETFWKALGAVGFAMEWPIPYMYEPLVRGYRRIAGLSDADLVFFLEHIPTDEDHGALIVGTLRPYLGGAEAQDGILRGAMESMDARERLIEAIYQEVEQCARTTARRSAAGTSRGG
jgi:pyrroloquinoline-quinone synthase